VILRHVVKTAMHPSGNCMMLTLRKKQERDDIFLDLPVALQLFAPAR